MNKESLSAPIDSGYFLANPGISGPFADEKPKLTPSQERALPALHSSRPVADRRRACPRQGSRDRDAKRSQSRRSPMDSWPCRPIRTSSPIRSANEKRNEPNSAVQCPGVFTAAHRTRLAVSTKMTKRSQSRPISLGSTPCSRIRASRSPLDERKTERSQFRRRPLPSLLWTRIGFRPGSGARLRGGQRRSLGRRSLPAACFSLGPHPRKPEKTSEPNPELNGLRRKRTQFLRSPRG